ncbi:MAG: hypothetical protein JNL98_26345 [Bryobacterales bacterium]|nr:hypothetical protein [Bryobacterales bacterium]
MQIVKLAFVAVAASNFAAAALINGDFSTSDLTGWAYYLTTNGDDGFGDVSSFDTTGGGASPAARFRIGQALFGGPAAGAGIRQSLLLLPGSYTLTADIASHLPWAIANSSGGILSVFLDGSNIYSFDFGSIEGLAVERSSFSVPVVIGSAGSFEFAFEFTRRYIQATSTPVNYIDNIQLSAEAPEPGTCMLSRPSHRWSGCHPLA